MRILGGHKLPDEIQAVVLEKPEKLTVKQIPMWPVESYGDRDLVLVKVEACGICGSDLRYYMGENPWAQHTLGRHMDNPPNIVLGHEFAGEVVAVLDEANEHLLGKRVAPVCSKVCGTCRYCTTGRENLCPNTMHTGHGAGWGEQEYFPGAYAEYVPAWAKGCYEIPDGLSYVDASMMDILAVCTHVARQGNVMKDEPVLILGAGPAGNGIAQVCRLLGASKVVLLDKSDIAMRTAEECGLDPAVDVRNETDVEGTLRERLGEWGAMTVFDSIGSEWSIGLGLGLLDKGGTLVNMAVHDSALKINQMDIGSERRVVSSCNFKEEEYSQTLEWLAGGGLKVTPWITEITRDRTPETFSELLATDQSRKYFKVVIAG